MLVKFYGHNFSKNSVKIVRRYFFTLMQKENNLYYKVMELKIIKYLYLNSKFF
jgi:hypothetical protein